MNKFKKKFLIKRCNRKFKNGTNIYDAIDFLHKLKVSLPISIEIVSTVFNIDFIESRKRVESHPCWKEIVENSNVLVAELFEEIKKHKEIVKGSKNEIKKGSN